MMDYAQLIKEAVSCRTFAESIGLRINRSGFAVCPFHGDNDASLKIYNDVRKGWCCFGCHKGGDVINFVMQYYGLGFQDAMRKLDSDFSLGILPKGGEARLSASERAVSAATIAARKAARNKQERLRTALLAEYETVYSQWIKHDRAIQGFRPTDRDAEFPREIADAYYQRLLLGERLKDIESELICYDHPEFRSIAGGADI